MLRDPYEEFEGFYNRMAQLFNTYPRYFDHLPIPAICDDTYFVAHVQRNIRCSDWLDRRQTRIAAMWDRLNVGTRSRGYLRGNGTREHYKSVGQEIADLISHIRADDLTPAEMAEAANDLPQNLLQRCNTLVDLLEDADLRRCDDCESWAPRDEMTHVCNDTLVCETCRDDNYKYSDCMATHIHSDEACPVYDSYRSWSRESADDYCTTSYGRRNYYEDPDAYAFFSDGDAYYEAHPDEDDDDDAHEDPNNILQYHHSRNYITKLPDQMADKLRPALRLGLELEFEVVRGDNRPNRIHVANDFADEAHYPFPTSPEVKAIHPDLGGSRYCCFEADGSLDYGFEMVTGYGSLRVHEYALKRILTSDNTINLRSHDTSTCGLHVHIDKANITPLHKGKLVVFINDPKNEPLIRAIARRYGRDSGYAKFKDKKITTDARNNSHDRYEALNFQNAKTIEFRLFKGSTKFATVMAALEFTRASWLFTRSAGITELDEQHFVKFINDVARKDDTKYLRPYLHGRGIDNIRLDKEVPEQYRKAA